MDVKISEHEKKIQLKQLFIVILYLTITGDDFNNVNEYENI